MGLVPTTAYEKNIIFRLLTQAVLFCKCTTVEIMEQLTYLTTYFATHLLENGVEFVRRFLFVNVVADILANHNNVYDYEFKRCILISKIQSQR